MSYCEECHQKVKRRTRCPGCGRMLCENCRHDSVRYDFSHIPPELRPIAERMCTDLLELPRFDGTPTNRTQETLIILCGVSSILAGFLAGITRPRPPYINKLIEDIKTCLEQLAMGLNAGDIFLGENEESEKPKPETIQ